MFARSSTLGWISLVAVMALGLYLLKYDVQALHSENVALRQNIEAERLALSLLEAEWVYLNRHERIANLAEKYLHLQPIVPTTVAHVTDVPWRTTRMAQVQEVRHAP